MKFSIIVPVYNVSAYLEKCLDSILLQEYIDYELIIVDDGSTDLSLDIAQKYKEKYSEKIVLISQENKGLGGARNTGIRCAKGEYLFFVDSDDYIEIDCLRVLDKCIQVFECDVIAFDLQTVDINGNILCRHKHENYFHNKCLAEEKAILLENPSMCTKIFKRALFNDVKFPEKQLYEDLAIYPILLAKAGTISVIDNVLYNYVQRPNSIISGADISRYREILPGFANGVSYFKECNLWSDYIDEFKYMAVTHVCIYRLLPLIYNNYKNKDIREIVEYLNENIPEWYDNKYMHKQYPHERKIMRQIAEGHFLELYMKEKIRGIIRKLGKNKIKI